MEQYGRNKKVNIVKLTTFIFAVLFVVALCCSVTLAFFGGSASSSTNVVLASIDVGVDYTFQFDEVILPNTTYTDANKYKLNISNRGNSGPVYVKVVMDSNVNDFIQPIVASPALWSNEGTNTNEYYYLSTLDTNTITFLSGFKTKNNLTNELKGKPVNIKFTVYAIQSQYGAVLEDYTWITGAPDAFKTFVGYTG